MADNDNYASDNANDDTKMLWGRHDGNSNSDDMTLKTMMTTRW